MRAIILFVEALACLQSVLLQVFRREGSYNSILLYIVVCNNFSIYTIATPYCNYALISKEKGFDAEYVIIVIAKVIVYSRS